MRDIKIKPTDHIPRELTQTLRNPKEITHKIFVESKDKIIETAERNPPQRESPEQYAENKIEHSIHDTVNHTGQVSPPGYN